MESARSFANKIWNASRFLFLNMERSGVEPWLPDTLENFQPEPEAGTLGVPMEDRWIFSRMNACAETVNRAIENYRYHEAALALWHFVWHEFCDWYIELKKLKFQENSGLNASWRNTLAAYETMLRLLHPAMPFITEELWQRLATDKSKRPVSIAVASYPKYRQELADHEAEREVAMLQEIITAARTLRTESKLDPKLPLEGTLYTRGVAGEVAQRHAGAIQKLANVTLAVKQETAPKSGAMRSTAQFDLVLHVPQAQEEAQRKREAKDKEQLEKNIASLQQQLANEAFLAKAPAAVVDSMKQKLDDYRKRLDKLDGNL